MAVNVYKVNANGMRIPLVSADPSSPENGMIWYNTTDNLFRKYENGATSDMGTAEVAALDVTYDNATSGLAATNVQDAIDEVDADLDSVEEDVADLVTLSGVAANAEDLGTFTGTTIPDASDIKEALQALETSVETKAASSVVSEIDQNVDDLITLSGVAENATSLGTFTGSTIPDNQTVKQALQALETSVETKAADADVIKKDGSVAFTAAQSMGGFNLTNVADPTLAQHAATKAYVDATAQGLKPKQAVRAASLADIDLATELEDGDIVDGVTLATGDRVLVKDQADAEDNGIYVVQATGAAVRATDFDSLSPIDEINGAYTFVQEGTQAGQGWVQTGLVATLGTDPIDFVYFNAASDIIGGDMILKTGNTLSVDLTSDAGLESSNPGNVAGQLRVKLDGATLARSSSGLKVADAGITGTQLAASVAGAGLAGGAGSALSVNVDDSTIEIATDTLQVKDAGITNAKVATGIDAAKLADGSVSNTEFQYLGGVTSDLQTQLDGKVDGTDVSATLTASQSNTALTALTFQHASHEGMQLEYKIKEATTNRVRTGMLLISTNGTDTSIVDTFTETGDVGVTWDLNISGADVQVRYTTTANNKTIRAVKKLYTI